MRQTLCEGIDSMEVKVISCPACGHSLNIEEGQQLAVCPACGNTVSIEYGGRSGGTGTLFSDRATSAPIATADIPKGWNSYGTIMNTPQSITRPFTASIATTAPDGKMTMFANTGEAFHQIKKGMLERHIEGGFDQQMRTPMRAFVEPADYLDRMASGMLNREFSVTHTFPLPREELKNIRAAREQVFNECRGAMAGVTGVRIEVQNVFVGGLMRVYAFSNEGISHCLLLGAAMKGMEYSYSPLSMMGFGGFGLLGGLFGAQQNTTASQEQTQTDDFGHAPVNGAMSAYVDWESTAVFGMFCPAPLTQDVLDVFCRFVRSYRIDPSIPARMEAMSRQTTDAMKRSQDQQFAAQQQAYRTRQAAIEQSQQAWWDRTQAHDAAVRRSYQAQMASEERRADFSEAIRGVNVYERPDGTTVEHTVADDRVFMKEGDPFTVRGATKGENVPLGWVELDRK